MNNKQIITVVDAPEITLAEDDEAGDTLLKFFYALGWNGEDCLDPCKIRTTKAIFDRLYETMLKRCANPLAVGMLMVNRGPSTDEHIPSGKVYLFDGWITPVNSQEGGGTDGL